jgi:hypothetical protein
MIIVGKIIFTFFILLSNMFRFFNHF